MALPVQITDDLILQDAVLKLTKLLEEDRIASIEKEKRDKSIQKAKILIELYSNGKSYEEFIKPVNGSSAEIANVNKVSQSTIKPTEAKFEYPADRQWKHKIVAVIKHENRVLTVKEIVDFIKPYETEYNESQLVGLVSNTVTLNLVKNNILKIHKTGGRAFYYGSPLWWDENGELKKEHSPIKKQEKIWE